MGVLCGHQEITPSVYRALRRHPELIEALVCFEDLDEKDLGRLRRKGWTVPKLQELRKGLLKSTTDLDKAWHGIHFLLTGSAGKTRSVLSMAVIGGRSLDLTRGMNGLLSPAETKAVASALRKVRKKELAARFDSEKMTDQEVYPVELWAQEDDASYPLVYYPKMVSFFVRVARRGNAVLITTG